MLRKAAAMLATCLMVLSALPSFLGEVNSPGNAAPATALARGPTPDNDSEPNNDFDNATLLTGSVTFGGSVGMGDVDYFKVWLSTATTPGGQADTLEVKARMEVGVTRMIIYDPARFELLHVDSFPPPGGIENLSLTAFIGGFYYIYLPNMGPCDYTFTTVKGTTALTADNDNVVANATDIDAAGTPYQKNDNLNNNSDIHDFYKVHLNYTQDVLTDILKVFLQDPPTGAFGIELYLPGSADYLERSFTEDMGDNHTITYSPQADSDYYIRVWAPHGSGTYSLKVDRLTGTADYNSDPASASALPRNDTAPHWYNATGSLALGVDPEDYYMVEGVVLGQTFNCTVTSTDYNPADRTPDIRINLFNNTGEEQPPEPPGKDLANPVGYSDGRANEAGRFFIHLKLNQWAGRFDLTVFTNSPPQSAGGIPNISFAENTSSTTIKLAQAFYDPEDDPLTFSYQVYGEDYVGNVDFTIGSDPNRTLTITPKPGWKGVFSLELTATDPYGETCTITVQEVWVFGVNHKPEVINPYIPRITLEKGKLALDKLDLTTVFQDPDPQDRLKYNVTGNYSIRVNFPPDPDNMIWPTGKVWLIPDIDFLGTEELVFTATDNGVPPLTSDPVAVTVEVIENLTERITVADIPRLIIDEGSGETAVNLTPYISSSWPDDAFYFEYLEVPGSHLTVNLTLDGRLTVRPTNESWTGSEVLRFRGFCIHGQNGTLTLTVEVKPVAYPPVFVNWSPKETSLNISEPEYILFKIDVTDKDTSPIQLKIKWNSNGVNVSVVPEYNFSTEYDTINTSEGQRTFTLRVTVTDGTSTIGLNWTITVKNVNRPPRDVTITFPPEGSSFEEDATINFEGAAFDDDDDPLNYTWYDGGKQVGSGVKLTTKLGPGKHVINFEASDGMSNSTASITVTVNEKKKPGFIPGFAALAAVAAAAVLLVLAVARRRKR